MEDVRFAVSAVDHERQVPLSGEPDMAIEPLLLLREGRIVPVAIEPGFPDRDDAWTRREVQDRGPILRPCLRRVVRLDADRREDPRMFTRHFDHGPAVPGSRADGEYLHDPGGAGSGQHTLEVVRKLGV